MTGKRAGSGEPIAEVVARLGVDELREVVARAAEWHPDVDRAVRLAASRGDDDISGLRAAVDSALRTRRFLDWRESSRWAADAGPVVDELRERATERPTRELVALVERAVGHVVKVIMHADDSNGSIGDLARDLLDIHALACDADVADPLALARWMARFGIDDQDFFVVDPVRYRLALGPAGVEAYRQEVLERSALPKPVFAVRHALERLAVLDGDVEAVVRLLGGDLTAPHQFIAVAEAMAELGRDDDVLAWARRGFESTSGRQVTKLYDLAVGVHERRGELDEVVALRRDELGRMPSTSSYAKLRAAAERNGVWGDERAGALGALGNGALVDVLLEEGEAAQAWEVAERPGWDPGPDRWYRLAAAREPTEPGDALLVYLTLATAELETANQNAYQRAARLLADAKRAAGAAGRTAAFDDHMAAVREQHRRRPTLMKILDKARL
ncbi:MAG TPA: hypothetical protein VFP61_15930 [Acidimicrobiales bacterium]|nr:hypothetical protein [Acidimicrobiales bacterium]